MSVGVEGGVVSWVTKLFTHAFQFLEALIKQVVEDGVRGAGRGGGCIGGVGFNGKQRDEAVAGSV